MLLCPTLNEREAMQVIMPQIDSKWVDEIVILDGGSTDGTVEYAKERGYKVITQQKPGLINAYRQVFSQMDADAVITFSPDGNSVSAVIPQVVEKLREGYDMVIASRYLGDATSEDDTWASGWGNFVFTGLINVLFGGKYTDAMGIYRGYTRKVIQDCSLMEDFPWAIENRIKNVVGVGLEPLLSMRAAKLKMKIAEVPGDEPARIAGEGKCRHYIYGFYYLYEMLQETLFWKTPTQKQQKKKSKS